MVLAGDIGGTKTFLGLFDPQSVRPRSIAVSEFTTLEHADLASIISTFLKQQRPPAPQLRAACFGVAGPVNANTAVLTNVPWRVEGAAIASGFDIPHVALLNDVQAMAYGVPLLEHSELHLLQQGARNPESNMALVAAGTGLGEALIHNVGGQLIPSPTESGHADFAARTEREIKIVRGLTERFGRASVEHVVSGRGLVNLHALTHVAPCLALPGQDAQQVEENPDAGALISRAAVEHRCPGCVEAFEIFVEAYGAEAGNLALRSVATGGVFIGGGIAPKILPSLSDGRFMRAFTDKPPFDGMLRKVPVNVILNERVGLLGAAVYASQLPA